MVSVVIKHKNESLFFKKILVLIAVVALYFGTVFCLRSYFHVSKMTIGLATSIILLLIECCTGVFFYLVARKLSSLWRSTFVTFAMAKLFSAFILTQVAIDYIYNRHFSILWSYYLELFFKFVAWCFIALMIIINARGKRFMLLSFVPSLVAIAFPIVLLVLFHFHPHSITHSSKLLLAKACYNLLFFTILIFCFPVLKNRYVLLLLMGQLMIVISDILTTGMYYNHRYFQMDVSTEYLWIFAKALLLFSAVELYRCHDFHVRAWFYKIDNVRPQIIFWGNNVALLFFFMLGIHNLLAALANEFVWFTFDVNITILIPFVTVLSIFTAFFARIFSKDYRLIRTAIVHSEDYDKSAKSFYKKIHFHELRRLTHFITDSISVLNKKEHIQKEMCELAAQAAHDIRTPITVIGMLIEEIDNKISPVLKEKNESTLLGIRKTANDLLLMQRQLASANLAAGAMEPVEHLGLLSYNFFQNNYPALNVTLDNSAWFALAVSNAHELMASLLVFFNGIFRDELSSKNSTVAITVDNEKQAMRYEFVLQLASQNLKSHFEPFRERVRKIGCDCSLVKADNSCQLILYYPLMKTKPAWWLDAIKFDKALAIVIFDDEQVYHRTWDKLLTKHGIDPQQTVVYHCYNEDDFISAMEKVGEQCLLLIDFEIKGSRLLGTDYIRQFNFQKNSILVTNHYDTLLLQLICEEEHIKLLPKPLLAHLTLKIQ